MHDHDQGARADLRLWESLSTAYRSAAGVAPLPGSDARTEAARQRTEADDRATRPSVVTVDLYLDPVCPYTWVVSRWLLDVERERDLDLRYHVMSLRMLNEGRIVDAGYRATIDDSVGPSRVATAVLVQHGSAGLRAWHDAFGRMIFDRWRYPTREEYHAAAVHALDVAGLPAGLVDAGGSPVYDEPLRRSHEAGTTPVGVDGGTPVLHVDGVAFFGPVLNAIPTGSGALRLFDGVRLLAGCPDFFELKRTRTAPPHFG